MWVEFVFGTTSNEDSEFETGNEESLRCVGQSEKGVVNPLRLEACVEGVRDPGSDPEFLCGCKRPGEMSQISVWV